MRVDLVPVPSSTFTAFKNIKILYVSVHPRRIPIYLRPNPRVSNEIPALRIDFNVSVFGVIGPEFTLRRNHDPHSTVTARHTKFPKTYSLNVFPMNGRLVGEQRATDTKPSIFPRGVSRLGLSCDF